MEIFSLRSLQSTLLVALAAVGLTGGEMFYDDVTSDDQEDRLEASVRPTSASGATVEGEVYFYADPTGGLRASSTLSGLSPGQHGVHIHTEAACGAADSDGDGEPEPGGAAGPHWDPLGTDNHGARTDPFNTRHAGDLGNITASEQGMAVFSIRATSLSIDGEHGVNNHAFMVHADQDNLSTSPGGNSGTRVGCGVIAQGD